MKRPARLVALVEAFDLVGEIKDHTATRGDERALRGDLFLDANPLIA